MLGDIDKEMFSAFMSQYFLLVSCGTEKGLLLPQILGELPDVLKTLDDENVKNACQHDINFEASSIHTVIFFRRQKTE